MAKKSTISKVVDSVTGRGKPKATVRQPRQEAPSPPPEPPKAPIEAVEPPILIRTKPIIEQNSEDTARLLARLLDQLLGAMIRKNDVELTRIKQECDELIKKF